MKYTIEVTLVCDIIQFHIYRTVKIPKPYEYNWRWECKTCQLVGERWAIWSCQKSGIWNKKRVIKKQTSFTSK